MNPMDVSRVPLRGLPKTVHGGQAWKLKGIEDYSHNLNPFGPPEDIDDIIASSVKGIDHYPDDSCTELREIISKEFKVGPDNVIIGAGSSDIIRMFPNTFLERNERAIISRPSFAEYSHQCRIAGADVLFNELKEEDSFRIDFDSLKKKVDDGAKAVYICNPNNPTGRVEKRDDLLDFAGYCEEKGTLMFLDETLLELVPNYNDVSCVRYVNDFSNLVIAGSLTKSFAIPGIRIGFGFSSKAVIEQMNKVRMTWNVGQIEQNVAKVLIGERMGHVHKAARILGEESKRMYSELSRIGFPITMTDSFFFFDSVKELGLDSEGFVSKMLENKIMVRNCSSFGDRFSTYARFCVKDRERNDKFIDAVKNVMGC